jgi:uncharacterized Fe-S radical SAM superfamily protein PflX
MYPDVYVGSFRIPNNEVVCLQSMVANYLEAVKQNIDQPVILSTL